MIIEFITEVKILDTAGKQVTWRQIFVPRVKFLGMVSVLWIASWIGIAKVS